LDDWTTVTRDHSLPEPTNDAEIMVATALALLAEYDPPRPVRLLGVRVAAFTETGVLTAPAAPKTSAPKADSRRRHEQLVLPGVTEL
jgi:DNA polymerase-4